MAGATMDETLILHEYSQSGNCYKIRLTAAHLGMELERREYDILKGETRTPEFLTSINANGRIPVLQVGRRFIPESNAACFYLGDGSALVPEDRFDRADMLRWMFFEQYNHEPNIATLRFWIAFVGEERLNDLQRAMLPGKREAGEAALRLMDEHLTTRSFFVGERLSLADIALYAYTHVAGEGGFDLAAYPAIGRWLERMAAEPGHLPMEGDRAVTG
jgi:glutathione S-transferase